VTEWLTQIAKRSAGDQQQERRLRRVIQRRMGWRSPLTIYCYDHSITEREEEEAFATFQREVEESKATLVPAPLPAPPTRALERGAGPFSSAALQQVHTDLAFWEDKR